MRRKALWHSTDDGYVRRVSQADGVTGKIPGDPGCRRGESTARFGCRDGVERHFGEETRQKVDQVMLARIKAMADAAHAVDSKNVHEEFMAKVGIALQSSIGQLQQLATQQ